MFSTDGMILNHDFEHGRLELTFSGKMELEEFQSSCLRALDYASNAYVWSWLVDLQDTPLLDDAQETWLATELLPVLMVRMGAGILLAVVISEESYQELFLNVGEQGLQSCNSFISIRTFCDVQKAREWLGNQRISNAS
ncbi:hypothetical protein SAMN04487941_0457 [Pontibacter akesuensis]|uniref:SpoIIAA-like n=2 Tax=Pontibacter akesuensis TaxID=388950 RepID=A0A1I7FTM6_9BACT|nr:hypothetical protein SAMN04487941_0457 [Pontibacter akesuensis]